MKKILQAIKNNLPLIPFIIVAGLLIFPIWSYFNLAGQIKDQNLTIQGQSDLLGKIQISGGSHEGEMLLGGITRVAVGAGVKWTTDLIPSASFTVDLGSDARPVDDIFTGDIDFNDEILPDGVTCSNGEILKKTGANNWDCAADATGAGSGADTDIPFVTVGNTASLSFERALTGTTNQILVTDNGADSTIVISIPSLLVNTAASHSFGEFTSYASAQFYLGTAFTTVGDCNDDAEAIGWTTTGVFICNSFDNADIPDAITVSGGTINSNTVTGTWTTSGNLTIGDGGDDVIINSNTWDVDASGVLTGATISTNNVGGTWTTTSNLTIGDGGDDLIVNTDTWDTDASGIFSGVAGMTGTGVWDLGGASSLDIPSAAAGSLVDAAGEITINTSSASFNFYDGTVERVLRDRFCKTWAYEDPTAINEWGRVYFDDPFTITDITVVTSRSSNAVGWNLTHGVSGAITTDVFAANKSASSTFTYTIFTDATLVNGEFAMLKITSGSATVENLDVSVCGRHDAP